MGKVFNYLSLIRTKKKEGNYNFFVLIKTNSIKNTEDDL